MCKLSLQLVQHVSLSDLSYQLVVQKESLTMLATHILVICITIVYCKLYEVEKFNDCSCMVTIPYFMQGSYC